MCILTNLCALDYVRESSGGPNLHINRLGTHACYKKKNYK